MAPGIHVGLAVALALAVGQPSDAWAQPAPLAAVGALHPLDPLTADEILTAVRVARGDARLAGAAFPSIAVLDPPKAATLGWQPSQPVVRHASLQAMTADRVYEVVVDLTGRRLVSVAERTGVEPSITFSEVEASALVLSKPRVQGGSREARDHRSAEPPGWVRPVHRGSADERQSHLRSGR
jgi:Cu2+-containing amine oxidase